MLKLYYSSGELSDVIKFDTQSEHKIISHIWRDKKGRELDILNYDKREVNMDAKIFGFMPIDIYCGEMTANFIIFRNIAELKNALITTYKILNFSELQQECEEDFNYETQQVEDFIYILDGINSALSLPEIVNELNTLNLSIDGCAWIRLNKCQIVELNKEFNDKLNNISDEYKIRKPSEVEIKNKKGCYNGDFGKDQPDSYVLKNIIEKIYLRISFGKIACNEVSY